MLNPLMHRPEFAGPTALQRLTTDYMRGFPFARVACRGPSNLLYLIRTIIIDENNHGWAWIVLIEQRQDGPSYDSLFIASRNDDRNRRSNIPDTAVGMGGAGRC